jgi:hypothetical protein
LVKNVDRDFFASKRVGFILIFIFLIIRIVIIEMAFIMVPRAAPIGFAHIGSFSPGED